jgi:hypothetical protein
MLDVIGAVHLAIHYKQIQAHYDNFKQSIAQEHRLLE